MIQVRKSEERGHARYGWLEARYAFSFGPYYDERHMGFRSLRVINEDHIIGGAGFPTHAHRDMEIITYVLEGELEHKDSMGTGSVIRPGDVQRMSAGSGVEHSEFNHSKKNDLHLFQIWILPEKKSIKPSYEQKHFTLQEKKNTLKLVGSPDGRSGSITVHQDVHIYTCVLDPGAKVSFDLAPGRFSWIQMAQGDMQVNGTSLLTSDAAKIQDETHLVFEGGKLQTEFLLFDLA